ncbi:MAG TPA: type II CAAX endopeptidase family protein [Feifaniaceae bacterium]|nr:type II CAAX endopeptidase family protein [Feifaniaceae bacterium]
MTKTKPGPITETAAAMALTFLVTIGFVLLVPAALAPSVPVPLKILFELSPYLLLLGMAVLFCKIGGKPAAEGLGFSWAQLKRQLAAAFVLFLVTISLVLLPLLFGAAPGDVLGAKMRTPLLLCYSVIKAMLVVGLGEELLFRGYFYGRLLEITGSPAWALVISSVFFGLWHYPIGRNFLQVLVTAFLGFLYGLARLKIRGCSTLATGLAHGLHDAALLALGYILL